MRVQPLAATSLLCGALALSGCGGSGRIGPPADVRGGGWSAGCVRSDHPAPDDVHAPGGCGWVAAPGGFAYCHDYPGGGGSQLTCYSSVSGWVVNIPAVAAAKTPRAWRLSSVVHRTTRALPIRAGTAWYDSMPERTAEWVCAAGTRFFRCRNAAGGAWFKRDGTFAVFRRAAGSGRTVLLRRGG